jgi:hypothetical protein
MINGRGEPCPCVPICHLKSLAIMQIIEGFGGDINENKSEITGITDYVSNSVRKHRLIGILKKTSTEEQGTR